MAYEKQNFGSLVRSLYMPRNYKPESDFNNYKMGGKIKLILLFIYFKIFNQLNK